MTNDEKKLKEMILSDAHPKLSDDFFENTFDKILTRRHIDVNHQNGSLKLGAFIRRHQLVILSFLFIGAFALHQGHQKYVEEELLHIDTLSMSSFSAL